MPPRVRRNPWTALWQTITTFEAHKISPWLALRNSIGVTLPLAAGAAVGEPGAGLAIATGALNVAFSDSHDPHLVRARRMSAASALVAFAVFAGAVSSGSTAAAVTVAGVWAFAAGILVALSGSAADLGVLSLVTLVVYAAVPHHPVEAAGNGALAFAGGLLQMALSLALWRMRRYAVHRKALGDLYRELSKLAHAPISATESPPASVQTTGAQNALATLDRDRSVDGERYRVLLSEAERIRLSLLMLRRLRVRIEREQPACPAPTILAEYLEVCRHMLEEIGGSLTVAELPSNTVDQLQHLHALSERMREACRSTEPPVWAMLSDARHQMDALTGQLRAVLDVGAYATPAGEAAFARRELGSPWTLRLAGTFATLRANLHLQSAAFRHAIRLAVCVAAGDAIGRGFSVERSYWLPMTIAIILKPDFAATFTRGVLRLAGTYAGLAFATGLVHILPTGRTLHIVLAGVLFYLARCFGPANYGVFVTAITALVVMLFAVGGVQPASVIGARAVNTVAGGGVALLAYAIWPTWERTQVPEGLARLLDAYREYFRTIREAYIRPERPFAHELDRKRICARLARSNLEASIDRLESEPGTPLETVSALASILASSHRMVQAVMALEAGLSSSRPAPARDAFRTFANNVELTLYYVAAALRGSPLTLEELPDLREDHHALIHSGDALTERYALVNVETDRITNSLNTLSEDVLRWLGNTPGGAAIE